MSNAARVNQGAMLSSADGVLASDAASSTTWPRTRSVSCKRGSNQPQARAKVQRLLKTHVSRNRLERLLELADLGWRESWVDELALALVDIALGADEAWAEDVDEQTRSRILVRVTVLAQDMMQRGRVHLPEGRGSERVRNDWTRAGAPRPPLRHTHKRESLLAGEAGEANGLAEAGVPVERRLAGFVVEDAFEVARPEVQPAGTG